VGFVSSGHRAQSKEHNRKIPPSKGVRGMLKDKRINFEGFGLPANQKGMRQLLFLLIILMVVLNSCSSGNPKLPQDVPLRKYPYKIDLVKGLENQEIFKLSDIADSIKYIKLSNLNNLNFAYINDLELFNDNIIVEVQAENPVILRFNTSGEYLNMIGRYGRGPGEYLEGSNFSMDIENGSVIVLRNFLHDFLEFKITGEYADRFNIKPDPDVFQFTRLKGNRLVKYYMYTEIPGRMPLPQKTLLCTLSGFEDTVIQAVPHPIQNKPEGQPDRVFGTGLKTLTAFYNDEVIISQYGLDTAYKANGETIYPAFIFDCGKYTPSYMQRYSYLNAGESRNFLKATRKVFETGKKIYRTYEFNSNGYIFEYDKFNDSVRSMKYAPTFMDKGNFEYDDIGFVNDIDGGASFQPWWTNRTGNIWISARQSADFKQVNNKELLNKTFTGSKSANEKLKKFISDLNEFDNPVLMLVYLKK
jgi:hypothetical protein